MSKPLTNRQRQAAATKKKLLKIATSLIQSQGYDSVTIAEICKKADISVGAFYHHLKSKSGIIIEEYLLCDEYFKTSVIGHLKGGSYCDQIIEYIGCQIEYCLQVGVDLISQFYKAQITEETEFFLSDTRILPEGLYDLIDRAQKAGELKRETTPVELGHDLLVISRGNIYKWCQKKGENDLFEETKKMISNYLVAFKI